VTCAAVTLEHEVSSVRLLTIVLLLLCLKSKFFFCVWSKLTMKEMPCLEQNHVLGKWKTIHMKCSTQRDAIKFLIIRRESS
jgi:hypothetical protein